ncbi:MAG: hypothetical protein P8Y78_12805 [Acidihalobacter sp.]
MSDTPESDRSVAAEQVRIEGLAALRDTAVELAEGAGRELAILSYELEPAIYDNAEFAEAVSKVARSGRRARVRLLIREHDRLVRHGHALVRLAQQLPSYIEIRRVAQEDRHAVQGYLVADDAGVLYLPQTDAFQAKTSARDRRWARDLLAEFQRLWDRATPDRQLRRLPLTS